MYGQAAGRQTLTIDQALEIAERVNPRLQLAGAQIDVADAGIVTARTRPNPEVNYLGGHQSLRLPSAAPGLLQHWGYSQLIETPAVRNNRIRAASLAKDSSAYGLEETRLLLRGAVKQAFYAVLRRQSEIEIAQEALKSVEDLRQRVQVQVAVGEAGRLELTRAEAEVASAQTLLRSAQLREAGALTELRTLLGGEVGENLDLRAPLTGALELPPLENVRASALTRHPALARADAEIRRYRARLDTEKALKTPQPSFIAEYEQMPDLRFFRAGLSIPLPIFNRREGPIREATATLTQAGTAAKALRLELTSALERAYSTYQVANQQLASIEGGALKGALAALEGAQAAFRFGERGILEVLDAQRVLRSIRSDYTNAQYDRQAALIELEQLQAIDLTDTNTQR